MSQLVERHPPDSGLSDTDKKDGTEHVEFLLQCSPWRSYEAATEAMLRLGLEIKKVQELQQHDAVAAAVAMAGGHHFGDDHTGDNKNSIRRARYVGGLDKEGLTTKFKQELQVNHRGELSFQLW